MKVFISHQQKDSQLASKILTELKSQSVEAYLDLFDDNLIFDSRALTEHLKDIVRHCSDILVVMSNYTKNSWWVPFEIGIAANQDLPTVTFLLDSVVLPEYLDYWPRLKKISDIATYVSTRKQVMREEVRKNLDSSVESFSHRRSMTEQFYEKLKASL